MTLPNFVYEGVGYRGLKLDGNAELKRKYLDYKTEFVVGQLMTFPAFMSVSTDDSVADDFGDYVFFVFVKVRGARIARLSQLPKEAEILVPPPSVFRVKAVATFGGKLTITLEQESCPLTYLSHAPSKTSLPSAAPALALGGSAAEHPKVASLSQALEALNVGLTEDCLDFAKKLTKEGVLSLVQLKDLSEAEAVEVLEGCGMKKLQVRTVMKSVATATPTASYMMPPAPPLPSQGETLLKEGQRLYGEQRFSEAAERWEQAALLQHAPSHAHLSAMLWGGRTGVAKDEKRAFALAAAGAALGCAHSKGALGCCYATGAGVAKDEARGLALGRESAAAGSCFWAACCRMVLL
jgi:hypothetical protein